MIRVNWTIIAQGLPAYPCHSNQLAYHVTVFVSGVELETATLNDDVNRLNEKVRSLQSANNTLYRQVGRQTEIMEEAAKEMSVVNAINAII